MRNVLVGGSALVIAGAVAAACTVNGGNTDLGSGLTFDPLPSTPSGSSAGSGLVPGGTPTTGESGVPATPSPSTRTVVVPPTSPTAVPTNPAGNPTVAQAPAAPDAAGTGTDSAAGADGATQTPPDGGDAGNAAAPAEPSAPEQVAAPPVAMPVYLPDGTVDCAQSKCIALTFSGGPGPATRQFLQALDAHNARATFFVTGAQVAINPDVMVAIAGTGNEVANGTWSQPNLTTLTDAEVTSQLAQTNDAVRSTVGVTPTLFRPMGGHTSDAVVQSGEDLGLTQILWDLDTLDYNYQNDPDGLATVLMGAQPGQIVMLHDTFLASATALERMLTDLTAQGYAFVTVSQLLRTGSAG